MAYSHELAERIRAVLGARPNVSERLMFGGIAFLVNDHMALGVVGDRLCARLGNDGVARALERAHTRPMDFTGKPLGSMVYVEPDGVRSARALQDWVGEALAFASSLPPKSRRRKA